MKKLLHIFITLQTLLTLQTIYTQSITWMKSYGWFGHDEGNAIVQTPDNGYILVARSIMGLRALRLNQFGDTIWIRTFLGGIPSDIIKTNDNNYVIVGGYSHITKIDINGNIIWTRGPFNPNVITGSIKESPDGNFVLCGMKDTLGILKKPYLLKLNSNGFEIWSRTYNSNIFDGAFSCIDFSNDNNYLLTGSYSDGIDTISDELFIMKTDTQGTPILFYGYDTLRYYYPSFINETNFGSFILGGGNGGPYLIKFSSSGTLQWYKRYITGISSDCRGIENSTDGGYLLTGWMDTSANDRPALLIKTDAEGTEQFRRTYLYAPFDTDYGNSVMQTSDSGFVITGIRANQNIEDILIIKTNKNGFVTIGIEPIGLTIPTTYKLYQNYPNPFNSNTVIRFDIALRSDVKITMYDILGREIKSLINDNLKAGTYELRFNALNLSSGIYYYTLIANNIRETKKMILVK